MCLITLSRLEFDEICRCQLKRRKDCIAIFSAFGTEIWPFAAWGRTPYDKRFGVRKMLPILDQIADEYLALNPQGGRFFIDWRGVYTHQIKRGPNYQFIEFNITERLPPLGMRGIRQ